MARVGQKLAYDQLVVGAVYVIEVPARVYPPDMDERDEETPPRLVVSRYIGTLRTKSPRNFTFSDVTLTKNGRKVPRLSISGPISTEPLRGDINDLAPRISMTGREVVTEKALSKLSPDVSAQIRKFTGGRHPRRTRKSRRTTRRKRFT